MILVITHKTDFTADYVINQFNRRKIPFQRLNCEDLLSSGLSFSCNGKLSVSLLGEWHYTSIWFRRTQLPVYDAASAAEAAYLLQETDSLLKNLFAVLDTNWVSRPSAVYHAENKLLQLKHAAALGFRVPPTLVTSDKEQVRQFYIACGERMIVKPLSHTTVQYQETPAFIFTNAVTKTHIDTLDTYDLTPCIFQQLIAKSFELRVTVVGDEVFAARVDSQSDPLSSLDWRRKRLPFSAYDLPRDIRSLCIELVANLGLQFGAIDLIVTPNGDYIFLEINPNGQWVWIERETGLPISEALIRQLLKK